MAWTYITKSNTSGCSLLFCVYKLIHHSENWGKLQNFQTACIYNNTSNQIQIQITPRRQEIRKQILTVHIVLNTATWRRCSFQICYYIQLNLSFLIFHVRDAFWPEIAWFVRCMFPHCQIISDFLVPLQIVN
jgi:hypothetical protein